MGSRLANAIKEELEIQIDQIYFWTDSKCVLNWIRGDGRRYKQFVAHRIGEIQERTDMNSWRWVPTQFNPADEATRPKTNNTLFKISEKWIFGPSFLKNSEEFWPREEQDCGTQNILDDCELKTEFVAVEFEEGICKYKEVLPDITRFSKWSRLIRTTSWILRFIHKIVNRQDNENEEKAEQQLTVREIEKAEKLWIKYSQQQSFAEDLRRLKNKKPLGGKSRLNSLCPEIEDECIVLSGRINLAACISDRTKKPYILDPHHNYTKLLIKHYHEKFNHRGMELVLNEIRQKYWIINSRTAVKSIFSNCLVCKKERAKPRPPIMGQLPIVRLSREIRPFVNVGMDYFGPIHVAVGRRKEKRWGVIFTCLAVRAIHLEIAHSLNTDSAIMAIQRMTARRGQVAKIYCDNGTNFKGAARELTEALQLDEACITNAMSSKGIEFRFNPPGAPHMGGVWEKLIGSVKKTIGKILYCQSIKDETLLTLFAAAENIINSRPLTRVSSDPEDLEALTPNHFLIGCSNENELTTVPVNPNATYLRKEWKKSQMLINNFWQRWTKEYLPSLTRRSKWSKDQKPVKINDVVVLVEDNAPKHTWKIGKIIALHPGPDGCTRVVDLKTSNAEYRRPVTKICRLEVEE